MFILMDDWSASWNAILICLLEVIVVSWIYGIDRFFQNIDQMGLKLQEATKFYFKVCLRYIAPLMLVILFICSLVLSAPSEANIKGKMYVFKEPYVQALAWLMSIFSISFIPLVGGWTVYLMYRNGNAIDWSIFQPSSKWKPQTDEDVSLIFLDNLSAKKTTLNN